MPSVVRSGERKSMSTVPVSLSYLSSVFSSSSNSALPTSSGKGFSKKFPSFQVVDEPFGLTQYWSERLNPMVSKAYICAHLQVSLCHGSALSRVLGRVLISHQSIILSRSASPSTMVPYGMWSGSWTFLISVILIPHLSHSHSNSTTSTSLCIRVYVCVMLMDNSKASDDMK